MKRAFFIFLFLFLSVVPSFAATVRQSVNQGNALYQKQQYKKAADKYEEGLNKDANSDVVNFNLGTALYKNKEYSSALKHLQTALLTDDPKLKERSYYNLGNTLYQSGISKEDQNIKEAIGSLENSLSYYEKAISLDGKDLDTKYNYEYVQKELERLKKKQERQNKQGKQRRESSSEQKNNSSEQSQEQQNRQENRQQKTSSQENKSEEQKSQQQTAQQKQNAEQQKAEQQKTEQQKAVQQNADQKQRNKAAENATGGKVMDKNQQPAISSQGQDKNAQEMSVKEAQMLLQDYQQNEEPHGLLNFFTNKMEARPVDKDW